MYLTTVPKLLMSRLIPDSELDTGVYGIRTPAIQRCWVVPSDDVLYTDTTQVKQTPKGVEYVKIKELTIPGGYEFVHVRVKLNIRSNSSTQVAYARIYKNGVAFGTEHQAGITYVEFTEDLAFSSGDTVELWLRSSGETSDSVNNLFAVSGREVVSYGTIGQVWGGSRGAGTGAYLSKEAEDDLSKEAEDYLSEEGI